MRILVSGATGFIGGHLCPALAVAGHEVSALVRPQADTSRLQAAGVTIHPCAGPDAVAQIVAGLQPDGIVHLATHFVAQHGPDDLAALVGANLHLGLALLDSAAANSVPWLIDTGTFWQHHGGRDYCPTNLYAATKQAFGDLARYYHETGPTAIVTLELNDTYGPRDERGKLLSVLLDVARSGDRLAMSPGEQLLDILHVDDVVAAFALLVDLVSRDPQGQRGRRYFISSGDRITLREFAELVAQTVGRKLDIDWGGRPYRGREVMRPTPGGDPLPGWAPKMSLAAGIREIWAED